MEQKPNHPHSQEIIISANENINTDNITFEPPIINDTSITDEELLITLAEPQDKCINDNESQNIIVYRMPSFVSAPIADYFIPIKWKNQFEKWNLVRFSTPKDGSCLFHAISNGFFSPYHKQKLNGEPMTRNKMVAAFRLELSKKLAIKISNASDSPTYYDILNNGNTSSFAEIVPEFKLSYMQQQLASNCFIGYGYMEFIGNAINKDIYILDGSRNDIYVTDELKLTIRGDRRSLILYYANSHYELVGIQNSDGTFDTDLPSKHDLIKFLYSRVLDKQI